MDSGEYMTSAPLCFPIQVCLYCFGSLGIRANNEGCQSDVFQVALIGGSKSGGIFLQS